MDAKRETELTETESRPFRRGDEPALERRVEAFGVRLSAQHRQLDEFFAVVMNAVERGSLMAARATFTRFHDALDAHITLEDRVFFLALRGLEPWITSELVRLVEDHNGFRRSLNELADLLAKGSVEEFSDAFDCLAVAFSQHEEREERLMAEVSGQSAYRLPT